MSNLEPTLGGKSAMTTRETLLMVGEELARARTKFGHIRCAHEAIAVIREEYLEAEREVFTKCLDRAGLRTELVQLAAMCVRSIEDLGLGDEAT